MSLYLEHFGLREAPFRITPHTDFFFSGGNRGATLEALVYAITHDEGIVKVTGEVGSGKTMLCRMLLEKLPQHVETIYLANPSMTRDEILFALADELGLAEPPSRIHLLLRTIQQRLVELYAEGKQIVMLIDEAHAMPADSLEEIRLLSNLESNRHKLLQIVLFGQPELDELLSRSEMRQLRERVTHNFALEPLHRQDIGSYIGFRMRAAGYHGPDSFTPAAIQMIAESSAGLTRRINILADKALLAAFSENRYQIDAPEAKAAIRDAKFGPMPGLAQSRDRRPLLYAAGAALATAVVGTVAWLTVGQVQPATPVPAAAVSTPGTVAPPQTRPSGPELAAPASDRPSATNKVPAAEAIPAQPVAATATETEGSQLERGLKAFAAWLPGANDDHYAIQLLRTRGDSNREVENFLQQAAKGLDPADLRVYRSSADGQSWLGVVYGEFPSRDAATQALAKLPAAARANGAYPRAVRQFR